MRRTLLLPLVIASGLFWALLAALPSRAGEYPVVVELYTSQGCNSCPPADRLLRALAERPDVIALSLHVNYWDYLGWHDTFAQAQFGERQARYRDAWGKRVVYTPQMIVHGRADVRGGLLGGLEGAADAAIAEAGAAPPPVRLIIRDYGGMLKCLIEPAGITGATVIWVAKYRRISPVEIARGENAGHNFVYANVVTSLNRIGTWPGAAPEEVALPQPGPGEGVAIWLQQGEVGPIIAAAKLENP